MNISERIKLCRIIEKMEGKEDLQTRVGIKNISVFSEKKIQGTKKQTIINNNVKRKK